MFCNNLLLFGLLRSLTRRTHGRINVPSFLIQHRTTHPHSSKSEKSHRTHNICNHFLFDCYRHRLQYPVALIATGPCIDPCPSSTDYVSFICSVLCQFHWCVYLSTIGIFQVFVMESLALRQELLCSGAEGMFVHVKVVVHGHSRRFVQLRDHQGHSEACSRVAVPEVVCKAQNE